MQVLIINKLYNCLANRLHMFEYDDVELMSFGKCEAESLVTCSFTRVCKICSGGKQKRIPGQSLVIDGLA